MIARRNDHEKSYLLQFSSDITSQCGEDGIIEHLFSTILSEHNKNKEKYCVDVGAWDGKHLSNTYNLCMNKGWAGALFEANTERCQEMKNLYKNNMNVQCIDSFVEFSGEESLSNHLSKLNVPKDFQFLSIDVDGADYHVWNSLDNDYNPQVVCIEFNPTIPNRISFIQEPNMRVYQGSSLRAMQELGIKKNYTLICATLFNGIFLHNSLLHLLPQYDRSIDALYCSEMSTDFFQTYDGELKYFGTMKLLWHKIGINPQKLQVLTKKDRKFPFSPPTKDEIEPLQKLVEKLVSETEDNFVLITSLIQLCFELISVTSLNGIVMEILEALIFLLFSNLKKENVLNEINSKNQNSRCLNDVECIELLSQIADMFFIRGDKVFLSNPSLDDEVILLCKKAFHINSEILYYYSHLTLAAVSNELVPKNKVIDSLIKCSSKIAKLNLSKNDFLESQFWLRISRDFEKQLTIESELEISTEKLTEKLMRKWKSFAKNVLIKK